MPTAREHVHTLLFGERTQQRFTQDSPVLPDVWVWYAEHPGGAADLLLTPYKTVSPGELAGRMRERIGGADEGSALRLQRAEIAHNQSTVAARLTFEELVETVLPLTSWWHDTFGRVEVGRVADILWSVWPLDEVDGREVDEAGRGEMLRFLPPETVAAARLIGTLALASDLALQPGIETPWDMLREQPGEVMRRAADLVYRALPSDESGSLIFTINQNRLATVALTRSVSTVKGDAACLLFDVRCDALTWAVIDSGIDATHPSFRRRIRSGEPYRHPFYDPNDPSTEDDLNDEGVRQRPTNRTRVKATYDFTFVRHLLALGGLGRVDRMIENLPQTVSAARRARLAERLETHRDEVRALRRALHYGRLFDWDLLAPLLEIPHDRRYLPPANEHGTHVAGILAGDWRPGEAGWPRPDDGGYSETPLRGVSRDLNLYDLRVLDENGEGDEFALIAALQFVRHLNAHKEYVAVHGANVSISIRHQVDNYACGWTPVCEEAERVVAGGVVVVAAAGNLGHRRYLTEKGTEEGYRSISITDPGNAEAVITVGATHSHRPHTYGVSFFSSRGPTGDGRIKPDLIAPGEKIESSVPGQGRKPLDGTSMAAPHVSGAAALLMARHRELAGRPARVKQILCETATDLGRERYFQGHGLVDVLRALQSI